MVQIDKIAPVTAEKAAVNPPGEFIQPAVAVDNPAAVQVDIQLPALHLTVHNLRQGNHLTGSPLPDHHAFGRPALQGHQRPVHGPGETFVVQWLEEIAAGLRFKGVEDAFPENRHKNQQTAVPLPAQNPGGFHPVRLLHLNIKKDQIEITAAL